MVEVWSPTSTILPRPPPTSTGLKYQPTSFVPSPETSSTFSPFSTPTRLGSGRLARGAGKASRSWNSQASNSNTRYASPRPIRMRSTSIGQHNVGAQHAAPLHCAAIAPGALSTNLSGRDDPAHLPFVPGRDPARRGLLPGVRLGFPHRDHERARGCESPLSRRERGTGGEDHARASRRRARPEIRCEAPHRPGGLRRGVLAVGQG